MRCSEFRAFIARVYRLGENQPRVTGERLRPGVAGTKQTLEVMRRLAREGAVNVNVREAAVRIVRAAGIASHDFAGEVRALFEYVRDRVRFTRDPASAEWLQSASYTLARGFGDCDDKATLLAALLMALGTPAMLAFRVVAQRGARGFSHVYVRARLGGRDVALDPTYPGTPVGWEIERPSRVGDFSL